MGFQPLLGLDQPDEQGVIGGVAGPEVAGDAVEHRVKDGAAVVAPADDLETLGRQWQNFLGARGLEGRVPAAFIQGPAIDPDLAEKTAAVAAQPYGQRGEDLVDDFELAGAPLEERRATYSSKTKKPPGRRAAWTWSSTRGRSVK